MTSPKRTVGQDVRDAFAAASKELGVSGALHPDDFIFWYIYDQDTRRSLGEMAAEYLSSGKDTAVFLWIMLNEARVQAILARRPHPDQPPALLEFASGYGRVTRHLPSVLPGFDVTACDIHRQAVDFTREMGFAAVQSASAPDALRLDRAYNVIFAFSFFTHMPRSTWSAWLAALADQLEPDGLLILTAHGEVSQVLMGVATLEDDGFFFHPASEQEDLDAAEYGNTVTTFEHVFAAVVRTGLKLVQFRQAGAGHHDVYVLHKDPAALHYRTESPAPSTVRAALARNQQLEAEIAALQGSTSWRVTRPLRTLATTIRGR